MTILEICKHADHWETELELIKRRFAAERTSPELMEKVARVRNEMLAFFLENPRCVHIELFRCISKLNRRVISYFKGCASARGGYLSQCILSILESRRVSQEELSQSALYASYHNKEVLRFLLSEGRTVPEKTLARLAFDALLRESEERFCFLFRDNPDISKELRYTLMVVTAKKGFYDALELLLKREPISASVRDFIRNESAGPRKEEIQALLDCVETYEDETDGCIATYGSDTMGYLLTWNATRRRNTAESFDRTPMAMCAQSRTTREDSIVEAARCGNKEVIELLLRQGPISASIRDLARSAAEGPRQAEIRDLLNSAEIAPEGTEEGLSGYLVSFSEVEKEPLKHLQFLIDQKKLPERVFLSDNPSVVDHGGVTKQFIFTLCESLLKKDLCVSGAGLPMFIKDSDERMFSHLGKLYSILEKANRSRTDHLVTGTMFNPKFFKLVQKVSQEGPPAFDDAIELLKEIDPTSAGLHADMILDPSNEAKRDDYAMTFGCHPDEVIALAIKSVMQYIQAARAIHKGLDEDTREKFISSHYERIAQDLQGQEASKESLIRALMIRDESPTEDLLQKRDWLIEKINSSNKRWRKAFAKATTGREVVIPGMKIRIGSSWRAGVVMLHTCFNTLDFPREEMSKEDFIELLNATVIGSEYNTA